MFTFCRFLEDREINPEFGAAGPAIHVDQPAMIGDDFRH
jgi:hypothetical protein